MTQIGKRYRIIDKVLITIIHPNDDEAHDYIMGPDDGELSFDGSNIIFHGSQTGKDYTTIMVNSYIDSMLAEGRLELVEKDS